MSISLHVYVGPYIEVWNCPQELIEKYDNILSDGRGESGASEARTFLIPNVDLKGVKRQLSWDRHSECNPTEIPAISHECCRFDDLIRGFKTDVFEANGEFLTHWGVVPGYH